MKDAERLTLGFEQRYNNLPEDASPKGETRVAKRA